MLESLDFKYDGIYSKDMGVINVSMSNLFDEPFLPTRQIKETKISGREKPYFQAIESEPLSFSMTLYFDNGFDNQDLRRVARWLYQDYYKPLFFEKNPSRIFYCMIVGDSVLKHNGAGEGYIEIEVRCDSPYSYTPSYTRQDLLFTENGEVNLVTHSNYENVEGVYENIIVDNGSLKIKNQISKWKDVPLDLKWGDIV